MNEFNYLDIYATKHIEYLWVIGFLVLFVGMVVLERHVRTKMERERSGAKPRRANESEESR